MDLPADLAARPLVALPPQPSAGPWPTEEWPTGDVPADVALEPLLDAVMDPDGSLACTRAVVVVHRGRLVAERYGDRTDAWGEVTGEPVGPETPLLSWSMAKSMLHAVVGMLVDEGRLDLDAPRHRSRPGDPATGVRRSRWSSCSRCATASTSSRSTHPTTRAPAGCRT